MNIRDEDRETRKTIEQSYSEKLEAELEPRPEPKPLKHVRATCNGRCVDTQPYGCNLCNLFVCSVCHGAEGSLPTDCPGIRMTEYQETAVYDGELDYRTGRGWVEPDGTGTSMGDQDIKIAAMEAARKGGDYAE